MCIYYIYLKKHNFLVQRYINIHKYKVKIQMLNIFNIGYEKSFSDDLVEGIFEKFGKDSSYLSKIKIFLPNRRSVIALREAFLRKSDNQAMLLPAIKPIADIGFEESLIFDEISHELLELPTVISDIRCKAILTKLIYKWQCQRLGQPDANVIQSVQLADDLKDILQLTKQHQVDLSLIAEILPSDLANHWQSTLEFFSILFSNWEEILKEQGLIDKQTYQYKVLKMLQNAWQTKQPEYPIIIAGSTGSIPVVADFIKAITNLKKGYVVLSGLDCDVDDEIVAHIDESHPQYYLNKLLNHLQTTRNDIENWCSNKLQLSCKNNIIQNIMLPANLSYRWQDIKQDTLDFSDYEILELDDSYEEAKTVSLILKQALDNPSQTACLVTLDSHLAIKVKSIMCRWDILINDSNGIELKNTSVANFFVLIVDMLQSNYAPIELLSCLKHPLASFGLKKGEQKSLIRKIEKSLLRGARPQNILKQIADIYPNIANILDKAKNLHQLLHAPQADLSKIIDEHIKFAELLANTDDESGEIVMWQNDYGEQFKTFLDEFANNAYYLGDFNPVSYLGVFNAFISGIKWRAKYGFHPRVSILTPQEARLQNFDIVIIGGLNEGVWPRTAKIDAWLNNTMRQKLGLPTAQDAIGKSAHDFANVFCSPKVFLTRAKKNGTTQNVASRWLLKTDAIIKITNNQHQVKPKLDWTKWAKILNNPDKIEYDQLPSPTPDTKYRPKVLSVSTITKLMSNPYEVYASKILNLKPLKKIDEDPTSADFGNIVHEVIDYFTKSYPNGSFDFCLENFMQVGQNEFDRQSISPSLKILWWARFELIAKWFVNQDILRRDQLKEIFSEISGEYEILDHIITAKTDRIEIYQDNKAKIIDFKTGSIPFKSEVLLGYAPQLVIEALILNKGGFKVQSTTSDIEYWKLNKVSSINLAYSNKKTNIEQLLVSVEAGITELIAKFSKSSTPYLCYPNPQNRPKFDDYKHLSRISSVS